MNPRHRKFPLYALCALAAAFPLLAADPFAEMDQAFAELESSKPGARSEQDEFERFKAQEQDEFRTYQETLEREFEAYKKIYEQESQRYTGALKKVWQDPQLSSKTVWVEYSQDMKRRSAVDFERQVIQLSSADGDLAQEELRQYLKQVLTKDKAQAFKDDALSQAVEARSKKEISTLKTDTVKPRPVLLPFVSDKKQLSEAELNAIVDRMLERQKRESAIDAKGRKTVQVEVPFSEEVTRGTAKPVDIVGPLKQEEEAKRYLPPEPKKAVAGHKLSKPAQSLAPEVSNYARAAKIDPALVFAVIETESAFNPMAKSPVPAYGLMQIVPTSAGQDATARIFGQARILSPSYLYNSENNIQVGTTYLNILYYSYLKDIKNEESRLYCAIAAYNTGTGNVAKAFTGKMRVSDAVVKINAMTPQQVYQHLVANLPYDETRSYLVKVNGRMPKYRAEG